MNVKDTKYRTNKEIQLKLKDVGTTKQLQVKIKRRKIIFPSRPIYFKAKCFSLHLSHDNVTFILTCC